MSSRVLEVVLEFVCLPLLVKHVLVPLSGLLLFRPELLFIWVKQTVADSTILKCTELSVLQRNLVNNNCFSGVGQPWLLFINIVELSMAENFAITKLNFSS